MTSKWETRTIGDCCVIEKKSINPEHGKLYSCYSLPGFDNSKTPELLFGEDIKSSKLVLQENTILFNKLNPKFRRVWNIHSLNHADNCICSTEFLPLRVKEDVDQDFLFYYISSPAFTNLMDGIRTGTSNSQQRIDWRRFLQEPIKLPDISTQKQSVSILCDIDRRIKTNEKINENLAA